MGSQLTFLAVSVMVMVLSGLFNVHRHWTLNVVGSIIYSVGSCKLATRWLWFSGLKPHWLPARYFVINCTMLPFNLLSYSDKSIWKGGYLHHSGLLQWQIQTKGVLPSPCLLTCSYYSGNSREKECLPLSCPLTWHIQTEGVCWSPDKLTTIYTCTVKPVI